MPCEEEGSETAEIKTVLAPDDVLRLVIPDGLVSAGTATTTLKLWFDALLLAPMCVHFCKINPAKSSWTEGESHLKWIGFHKGG